MVNARLQVAPMITLAGSRATSRPSFPPSLVMDERDCTTIRDWEPYFVDRLKT